MKTAFVVSASPTRFSSVTYAPDLEKKLRQVSSLGYDAVELHVRAPRRVDVDLVNRVTTDCTLPVCAVGTGQAYVDDGLSFCHSDDSVRAEAARRIKEDTEFASAVGAPIVIIGLVRGRTSPGVEKARAVDWIRQAILDCAAFSKERGIRLVLEPINRYETDVFNTVTETMDFVRGLQTPDVGLLLDTFHMNIEEPSICGSIRDAGKMIFHVHAVDSNRWAPGYGHLDLGEIVAALSEVGYEGCLSAEILPLPTPDHAAETAIRTLRGALGKT